MDNKISILLRTSDFRGDHATDILTPLDIDPDITIRELVDIVFVRQELLRTVDPEVDHIEIMIPSKFKSNEKFV